MRPSLEPTGSEHKPPSRRIPHSAFGIGAFILVLLAALVLVFLSRQHTSSRGAVILVLIGTPILVALTVLVSRRWRRARLGRA